MRSVTQLIRQDLRLFGVWKTIYDVALRSANRVAVFKHLKILKMDLAASRPTELVAGLQARFLSPAEMAALPRDDDFEVDEIFLQAALHNGDACFGIFIGQTLVSCAWYSTQPTLTWENLAITLPSDQVYLYKVFTRGPYRGRRLFAIGAALAMRFYHTRGFNACVAYVESNNFSSLNAFRRLGARRIGHLRIIQLCGHTWLLPSASLRQEHVAFQPTVPPPVQVLCA